MEVSRKPPNQGMPMRTDCPGTGRRIEEQRPAKAGRPWAAAQQVAHWAEARVMPVRATKQNCERMGPGRVVGLESPLAEEGCRSAGFRTHPN